MRTIETRKGRVIESPWMRPDDAAAYCGLSVSEFYARAKDLPHGGGRRLRLYNVKVLDRWIQGDIVGAPFDPEEQKQERKRAAAFRGASGLGYLNPNSGKFKPCVAAKH